MMNAIIKTKIFRRRHRDAEGKGPGKMEAEIKGQPQAKNAKDCQPPEAEREAWNGFSLRALRGKQP